MASLHAHFFRASQMERDNGVEVERITQGEHDVAASNTDLDAILSNNLCELFYKAAKAAVKNSLGPRDAGFPELAEPLRVSHGKILQSKEKKFKCISSIESCFGLAPLHHKAKSGAIFVTSWPIANNRSLHKRSEFFDEDVTAETLRTMDPSEAFLKSNGEVAATFRLTELVKKLCGFGGPTVDCCPFAPETQVEHSGVYQAPPFYTDVAKSFWIAILRVIRQGNCLPPVFVVQGKQASETLLGGAFAQGFDTFEVSFPGKEFVKKNLQSSGVYFFRSRANEDVIFLAACITSLSRLVNYNTGNRSSSLRATELICSVVRFLCGSHATADSSSLREATACSEDEDDPWTFDTYTVEADTGESSTSSIDIAEGCVEVRSFENLDCATQPFVTLLEEADICKVCQILESGGKTRRDDNAKTEKEAIMLRRVFRDVEVLKYYLSKIPSEYGAGILNVVKALKYGGVDRENISPAELMQLVDFAYKTLDQKAYEHERKFWEEAGRKRYPVVALARNTPETASSDEPAKLTVEHIQAVLKNYVKKSIDGNKALMRKVEYLMELWLDDRLTFTQKPTVKTNFGYRSPHPHVYLDESKITSQGMSDVHTKITVPDVPTDPDSPDAPKSRARKVLYANREYLANRCPRHDTRAVEAFCKQYVHDVLNSWNEPGNNTET